MFALVLFAFLGFLAIACLAVLADSALRWRSAYGALKRQMGDCERTSPQAPICVRNHNAQPARALGSRQPIQRAALRAAA